MYLNLYISNIQIFGFQINPKTKSLQVIQSHPTWNRLDEFIRPDERTYSGIARKLAFWLGFKPSQYDLMELLDYIKEHGFHADSQDNLRLEIVE